MRINHVDAIYISFPKVNILFFSIEMHMESINPSMLVFLKEFKISPRSDEEKLHQHLRLIKHLL